MNLSDYCDALRRELWHLEYTLDQAHDALDEIATMALELKKTASVMDLAVKKTDENDLSLTIMEL